MKVLLTVVLNEDGQMVAEGDPLTPLESMAVAVTVTRYLNDLIETIFEPVLNPVINTVKETGRVLVPCITCKGIGWLGTNIPCGHCDSKGYL